ncbi:MAG: aspartate aminotransferase family protein [Bacteroidales bacterium]|nr:aspartate aminotransferase family protein [Bacteroidales bacterium]
MSEQQLSQNTDQSDRLSKLDQEYYLPTYKRLPLAFASGKGCKLWDVDGNEYLDALAGIAVTSLGHTHTGIAATITEQAARLLHVSNFFVTEPQVKLARRLAESSGLDHVFLSNSGTESFEGAVKLARKYAYEHNRGGGIISMHNSFHGRTMAAVASSAPEKQEGFGPMPEGFVQVPFNDIDALKKIISDDIAAIVLEPVQGEGGIHVAQREYLHKVRELCDANNIILIFDEIQCGMGRTGQLFAKEHFDVQPDIITLAKALGNGIPIGAIISNKKISDAINYGDHGTTFGGNPLASAVALTVLDEMQKPGFLKNVIMKGELLKARLKDMQKEFGEIREVRGLGLMLGIELDFEAKPLVMTMLENGVVANATAGNVLRLVPPLIISEDEIEKLIEVIKLSITEIINKS